MKATKKVIPSFVLAFFLVGAILFCTADVSRAAADESATREELIEQINSLEGDMEELTQRLDEVETKTLVDKVSFGAELRTRFDWFHFDDNDTNHTESVDLLPSNRFRLNMKADVSKNINFTGRLVVYKNWIDDSISTTRDMNRSRVPTDTTVKLERATMDYFFDSIPAALTFGRLPMTDGLPTDLRENTPRKSTYPSMAYDVEGEGIAFSYGLEDLIHLPDSAIRLLYVKLLNRDDGTEVWEDDALEVDDLNVYLAQFESGFPGAMKDCIFIANFIYLPDVASPGDLTDQGLTAVDLPDSLGSMTKITFFVESKRFLGSIVDWFAGVSYVKFKAEDAAIYDTGAPAPFDLYQIGLMNNDGTSDNTGNAINLGLRFNLPFQSLNEPKFGIEYHHGSEYWMGMNFASEDPLRKLSTAGDAWDFYWIQPIDRYFSIRAGHTMVHYDYENPALYYGSPTEVDKDLTNTYVLLDIKF